MTMDMDVATNTDLTTSSLSTSLSMRPSPRTTVSDASSSPFFTRIDDHLSMSSLTPATTHYRPSSSSTRSSTPATVSCHRPSDPVVPFPSRTPPTVTATATVTSSSTATTGPSTMYDDEEDGDNTTERQPVAKERERQLFMMMDEDREPHSSPRPYSPLLRSSSPHPGICSSFSSSSLSLLRNFARSRCRGHGRTSAAMNPNAGVSVGTSIGVNMRLGTSHQEYDDDFHSQRLFKTDMRQQQSQQHLHLQPQQQEQRQQQHLQRRKRKMRRNRMSDSGLNLNFDQDDYSRVSLTPHGAFGTADSEQQQQQPDLCHSQSFSRLARRHWSKLANVARQSDPPLPSPRIPHLSDGHDVISEPFSYSNAAYVASDMWLVQRDVQPIENELASRDRIKRVLHHHHHHHYHHQPQSPRPRFQKHELLSKEETKKEHVFYHQHQLQQKHQRKQDERKERDYKRPFRSYYPADLSPRLVDDDVSDVSVDEDNHNNGSNEQRDDGHKQNKADDNNLNDIDVDVDNVVIDVDDVEIAGGDDHEAPKRKMKDLSSIQHKRPDLQFHGSSKVSERKQNKKDLPMTKHRVNASLTPVYEPLPKGAESSGRVSSSPVPVPSSTNTQTDAMVNDVDEESPSSILVSEFFSGAVIGHGSTSRDRDRPRDTIADHRHQRRRFPMPTHRHTYDWCHQPLRPTQHAGQFVDPSSYQCHPVEDDPRRRVSRARRIRWWFRRISHRIHTDHDDQD